MKTISLNENWEPEVNPDGTLKYKEDAEALAQYVKQALLLWESEYWLDTDLGVNYSKIFTGKGEPNPQYFIERVNAIGYGARVIEYDQSLDPKTRRLNINMTLESDFGRIII